MAKKSILKNYTYHLAYQILVLILPLITTPYVSRVLGAEAIGIYGYTYSIVTYFILFGSLGIALYGQREIAYAQENKKARMKAFVEIILFRFVTMTVSILAYYFFFVKGGEYQVYYKILMIALIASAFDISWFFQGLEEFKKTALKAYAIYSSDDKSLTFIRTSRELKVGYKHYGKTITGLYTGFETKSYGSGQTPWASYAEEIKRVEFKNKISPLKTTWWFSGFNNCEYLDVGNLDTSNTTDISYMFYFTYSISSKWNINIISKK